jgi:hypothetical protein
VSTNAVGTTKKEFLLGLILKGGTTTRRKHPKIIKSDTELVENRNNLELHNHSL